MARVDIDNLTVRFGGVTAVDGLSLTLDDGQFIVLLGPSGCGKTTTLRCVAGLQRSTSGEIRFNGKVVTELPPAERNIGMVFQFVSLYPHLTVRQNIAFPLRARGVARSTIAARVARVVEVFAIGDILDRFVVGLPPGSRQKVALARAVVREPDVLLLDEPCPGWRSSIVRRCAGSCVNSRRSSASPRFTSPTTSGKLCRWPIGSY